MGERADDAASVEVGGALFDVARVGRQPLVVGRRDAKAQDVHRLALATEARCQLFGDEGVRLLGDRERAVDGVVVGDRHEVHAAPLGELVDLCRRRRAFRQPERALDAQA